MGLLRGLGYFLGIVGIIASLLMLSMTPIAFIGILSSIVWMAIVHKLGKMSDTSSLVKRRLEEDQRKQDEEREEREYRERAERIRNWKMDDLK